MWQNMVRGALVFGRVSKVALGETRFFRFFRDTMGYGAGLVSFRVPERLTGCVTAAAGALIARAGVLEADTVSKKRLDEAGRCAPQSNSQTTPWSPSRQAPGG